MRPSALNSCEKLTKTPAVAIDQCWFFINQTSMNVKTTVWGTMSSADAK